MFHRGILYRSACIPLWLTILPVRSTPQLDWTAQEEDQQDKQVWEDNWDDDKVADDFSIQLR